MELLITEDCKDENCSNDEIILKTSKIKRKRIELEEDLLIVDIQIGKIEFIQQIINEIIEGKRNVNQFRNVMVIMGIGIIDDDTMKLLTIHHN